jgi:hypothetical protein
MACGFLPALAAVFLIRLWYREDKAEEAEIARERIEAQKARLAGESSPGKIDRGTGPTNSSG